MIPYIDGGDVQLYLGEAYEVLVELEDECCDAIVTSPPYLDARPEYPSPTVEEFSAIFRECRRVCSGTLLLNVGRLWREREELLWWLELVDAAKHAGWPHRDTTIWIKPNANPFQGEIVTNAHEYVFMFGDGFDPETVRTPYAPGSVERLGRRWISTIGVKNDPNNNPRLAERRGERRDANPNGARAKSFVIIPTGKVAGNKHPAPMALDLAEHLVKLSGGSRILDPFCGSGTTLIAAKRLGRQSIGIELSEEYCRMAAQRLETWWKDPLIPREEPIAGQESLL